MANYFDYISWRGDVAFDFSPFNEVDALILCQITYVCYDELVTSAHRADTLTLEQLWNAFYKALDYDVRSDVGAMINPLSVDLFKAVAASPRFRDMRISGYINKIDLVNEEQFCSATYSYYGKQKFHYVCYRGTDDTIVGWKEDCNLCFMDIVPAQTDALECLEKAAESLKGDIYVGGHSKGGNLAVYASSRCQPKTKKRIVKVFNNDGPGFKEEFFKSQDYLSIKDRIFSYVPQLSIVGMLFSHSDDYITVESDQKGLYQHDPFSWHILGPHFVELDDTNDKSKFIGKTINDWISGLSAEQKEQFVETVFGVLYETKCTTNSQLVANWTNTLRQVFLAMKRIDPETKEAVNKALQLLFKEGWDNLLEK